MTVRNGGWVAEGGARARQKFHSPAKWHARLPPTVAFEKQTREMRRRLSSRPKGVEKYELETGQKIRGRLLRARTRDRWPRWAPRERATEFINCFRTDPYRYGSSLSLLIVLGEEKRHKERPLRALGGCTCKRLNGDGLLHSVDGDSRETDRNQADVNDEGGREKERGREVRLELEDWRR